jgi:hypothetical protein
MSSFYSPIFDKLQNFWKLLSNKQALEIFLGLTAHLTFPLLNVSCYFGPHFYMKQGNPAAILFYRKYIFPIAEIYHGNIYLIFAITMVAFIVCARGTVRLTKFARQCIIQAILLEIMCTCLGQIYAYFPPILKNSYLGTLYVNLGYLGTILLILYSCFFIAFGRLPFVPFLSEGARLNIERSYLDD